MFTKHLKYLATEDKLGPIMEELNSSNFTNEEAMYLASNCFALSIQIVASILENKTNLEIEDIVKDMTDFYLTKVMKR